MSQAPEGEKSQITKGEIILAFGVVAMAMVYLGSQLVVHFQQYYDLYSSLPVLAFWVINFILAGMGIVAFVIGTTFSISRGRFAYISVSFLSALMALLAFGIFMGTTRGSAGTAIGLVLCSIGWIIGLIAGIIGIVVTSKPTNKLSSPGPPRVAKWYSVPKIAIVMAVLAVLAVMAASYFYFIPRIMNSYESTKSDLTF
ncbi:MAG: hypothetical protein MUP40_03960, partial [Actinobacteria bacterium]|nr:hypothetical protein [Actinomycetota bacterium]